MKICRRTIPRIAALLLILSQGGCNGFPRAKELGRFSPDQVLLVNGKGDLLLPVGNSSRTKYSAWSELDFVLPVSEEAPHMERVAADITRRLDKGEHVVLFIHGGLNTQVDTMTRARRLIDLRAESAPPDTKAVIPHFVLLNWQSSLISSYRDRLIHIREGKDFREREGWKRILTLVTVPFYFTGDVLSGIARTPITWERQLATWASNLDWGPNSDFHMAQGEFQFVDPDNSHVSSVRKSRTSGFKRFLSTLCIPVRMVTTPLVDGFGTPAWDVMQRRVSILFEREAWRKKQEQRGSVSGDMREEAGVRLGDKRENPDHQGPLHKFGEALSITPGKRPQGQGKLTIVGHSMGAIIATELCRRFPELRVDHIVFMAAACSVRDVVDGVFPYLAKNPGTQFHNLVLNPKAEIQEANFWHMAPEGSLLVWLDQILDKPDSPLDRRAGRYTNLGLNARYLKQEADRTHPTLWERLSIRVFPYHKAFPTTHGAFGDEEFLFWDPENWRIK